MGRPYQFSDAFFSVPSIGVLVVVAALTLTDVWKKWVLLELEKATYHSRSVIGSSVALLFTLIYYLSDRDRLQYLQQRGVPDLSHEDKFLIEQLHLSSQGLTRVLKFKSTLQWINVICQRDPYFIGFIGGVLWLRSQQDDKPMRSFHSFVRKNLSSTSNLPDRKVDYRSKQSLSVISWKDILEWLIVGVDISNNLSRSLEERKTIFLILQDVIETLHVIQLKFLPKDLVSILIGEVIRLRLTEEDDFCAGNEKSKHQQLKSEIILTLSHLNILIRTSDQDEIFRANFICKHTLLPFNPRKMELFWKQLSSLDGIQYVFPRICIAFHNYGTACKLLQDKYFAKQYMESSTTLFDKVNDWNEPSHLLWTTRHWIEDVHFLEKSLLEGVLPLPFLKQSSLACMAQCILEYDKIKSQATNDSNVDTLIDNAESYHVMGMCLLSYNDETCILLALSCLDRAYTLLIQLLTNHALINFSKSLYYLGLVYKGRKDMAASQVYFHAYRQLKQNRNVSSLNDALQDLRQTLLVTQKECVAKQPGKKYDSRYKDEQIILCTQFSLGKFERECQRMLRICQLLAVMQEHNLINDTTLETLTEILPMLRQYSRNSHKII